MDVDNTEYEETLKRHRQEKKDLQSKIQQLKKTAPKGKKKKEIADQVVLMEKELDEKQNSELEKFGNVHVNNETIDEQEQKEEIVENTDLLNKGNSDSEKTNNEEPVKVSRAQKRRNKKAAEDKERQKRINEQEEVNKQGPRVLELNTIKENLKKLGLAMHNIPADGNCLYCAISHQLETKGKDPLTVNKLRKDTADFIRENKDDFLPFMYNEHDEDIVNDKQFDDYCNNVANTKLWGGQLELRALSNILKCPIKIIQATGQPTLQGENFGGPELVLTYHRHLYRLGEHYNSTVLLENEENDKS